MPDHKFRQHVDRNYVLLDAKQRIIDLMENGQELPEVGIYDEPVRYFKANEEWCKIIFGWLDWLEDVAGWKDAEDDNYSGIQQILIFEEGIELPMSIDYDALKNAIRDGTYEAVNDLAAQLKSGKKGGFNVGEDGTVTDPTTGGGEELPEDDPATADIDERKAAHYAGFLSVTYHLKDFLAYVDFLYGPVNGSPVTSAADAKVLIGSRYVVNPSMNDGIDAYWAARATTSQITTLDREDLTNHLYCNQSNDTQNNVADFIAGLSGFTTPQKITCMGLTNGFEETQWNIWYDAGTATYSTEYKSAPCEPIDDYSFTLQFNTTFNDSRIFKAYHRYEVICEGYGVDTDGDYQDAFWHKQTGQNEVFDATDFNIQIGQAVKIKPDVFEAPYNPTTRRYKWVIDMGPINASPQWTMNRDATMSVSTTSPSGGFAVSVKDLGYYR